MRVAIFCGAAAIALMSSTAFAQAPATGNEMQQAPQDRPQGKTTAPDYTTPPPPQSQPQAPIADQAAPAAIGPAQNSTASNIPGNAPPGATGQTMPSTISADNAKLDKLPITALQFPLTADQKALIARSVAAAPATSDGKLANVHVTDFLPTGTSSHEFSLDVMREIPSAKKYQFVKLEKRLLIVDPPNQVVVGEFML